MEYNVKYRTKDHSLGYDMAVNGDTTLRQINNFTNGYSIALSMITHNILDFIERYGVVYIYLSKSTRNYTFVKNPMHLPELEEMEENNEM